ncbi:MAG: hypothetical protein O2949_11105 [Proteobacteria bacterium]|nr:hypothetical protein [Pseudomonadota bacterium]
MPRYELSVVIGYEVRSVELTEDELAAIKAGKTLTKVVDDDYEGDIFQYSFQFNYDYATSLTVSYSMDGDPMSEGDGYVGDLSDAEIRPLEEP